MNTWYQTHDFKRLPLEPDSQLPPLTIVALDHLSLITATGEDTIAYLQGQLTSDLVYIANQQFSLTAHCDAKGKVWSVLTLFH
ncbi:MAG: hypothetical protein ACRC1X_08745, partial [Lactobacillus panisapium]